MHLQYGLPMFALASGAVSNPTFSYQAILKNFLALVLPVVLMYVWYQLVWDTIPLGKVPTAKIVYKNLIGLHTNFLWYLKALFCWRTMLMTGDCLAKAYMQ